MRCVSGCVTFNDYSVGKEIFATGLSPISPLLIHVTFMWLNTIYIMVNLITNTCITFNKYMPIPYDLVSVNMK